MYLLLRRVSRGVDEGLDGVAAFLPVPDDDKELSAVLLGDGVGELGELGKVLGERVAAGNTVGEAGLAAVSFAADQIPARK